MMGNLRSWGKGRRAPWCRLWMDEGGATAVLVTLLSMVLIATAALGVDGANAYLQRWRAQNAADAAALAGARSVALGESRSGVEATIQELTRANQASLLSWAYTDDGRGVVVEVSRRFPTYFAGIIGYPEVTVVAEATARTGPVVAADNLLPMTVNCMQNLVFGEEHILWDREGEGPGVFGWLDWNGGSRSNNELVDNIENPANSGRWEIGEQIPAGPGVQNSSGVRNALRNWLNRPVTIPLYSQVTGNGANARYEICGFAEFVITDFNFQGRNKWVQGRFQRALQPGKGSTDPSVPDYGLQAVFLDR